MTIQEIMAQGAGFWVVVMVIVTSVLTRDNLLGEKQHDNDEEEVGHNFEDFQMMEMSMMKGPTTTTTRL